jgi:hypothetical protein
MAGNFVESFNQQLDPQKQRFRIHTLFTFVRTPNGRGITVQTNETGPFALLEFTGALPRAKLYTRWQVSTNDESTLKQLGKPEFDPEQVVLVSDEAPAPPTSGADQNAGTVQFAGYAPKHLQLRTQAATPTLLLLNDKFDPDWKVHVDGQPAKLLRCNFLMRGVYLPAGNHTVQFDFRPSLTALYVTSSAMVIGLLLCGFLAWAGRRETPQPAVSETRPASRAKQPAV